MASLILMKINICTSLANFYGKQQFVGYAFKGRNYGMVATSFGLSDTLFKF
jgi:hypothetical protein